MSSKNSPESNPLNMVPSMPPDGGYVIETWENKPFTYYQKILLLPVLGLLLIFLVGLVYYRKLFQQAEYGKCLQCDRVHLRGMGKNSFWKLAKCPYCGEQDLQALPKQRLIGNAFFQLILPGLVCCALVSFLSKESVEYVFMVVPLCAIGCLICLFLDVRLERKGKQEE